MVGKPVDGSNNGLVWQYAEAPGEPLPASAYQTFSTVINANHYHHQALAALISSNPFHHDQPCSAMFGHYQALYPLSIPAATIFQDCFGPFAAWPISTRWDWPAARRTTFGSPADVVETLVGLLVDVSQD